METNKIYNENCLVTMGNMEDNFIDLTVTSPPYDNLRSYKNKTDESWNENVWKPIIKELYRITKVGGVVVWVVADATIKGSETGTSFKQALYFMECGFNLHDTMIYRKSNVGACGSNKCYWQSFEYMFVFSKGKISTVNRIKDHENKYAGGKTSYLKNQRSTKDGYTKERIEKVTPKLSVRNNVWEYSVGFCSGDDKTDHPAVFPENLVNDHIISWSNEGDLVYDPFGGSGTTAKMAVVNNRNYIMSEISKEYCEIMKNRLLETI